MLRRVFTLVASIGLVGSLMAVSAGSVLAATCTTTCHVSTTGSDVTGDGSSGAPFQTINKALATVASGGTVVVDPGTYPEFVDIGLPVTLQGANSGVSCLGARGPESIVTGTTAGAFKIDANSVTINGFQVSDAANVGPIGTEAGISMSAATSGAVVENNLITNNFIGIYANSAGASLISCNSFVTNLEVGTGVSGAHIYSEFTQNLTIDRNDFGSQTGANANNPIIFGATAAAAHNDLVFSNNLMHDTDYGILVLGVDTARFSGNDINTNGATAITFDGADTHITVDGNLLHDNARGVRVRDAGAGLGDSSDIHVNGNALTGNAESDGGSGPNYGIGNEGGYGQLTLDGECNWWGSASGPGTVGPGSGDLVTTQVDFEPWLLTSNLTTSCRIHVVKTRSVANLPVGGGSVTYTFVVTSLSSVPLSTITVVDTTCTPAAFVGGDTNSNTILDPTETWTYTCTRNVTSSTTNTVTVTGHFEVQTVQDTDVATVTVAQPPPPAPTPSATPAARIAIDKTANPTQLAAAGSVTYTFSVTNAGSLPLTGVTVSDNSCAPVTFVGGDTNTNGALDLSEIWTYTCARIVTQTTTNTAVASGTGGGTSVTASDQATVTVAASAASPTPAATVAATSRPRITPPPTNEIGSSSPAGSTDGIPIVLLVLIGLAAFAPMLAKANRGKVQR